MPVYVDAAIWKWQGRRWCHLLADDVDELHRFAFALGVKRTSYQGPPKTATPHYDITAFERDRALRLGAIAASREEIVAVRRLIRDRETSRPGGQSLTVALLLRPDADGCMPRDPAEFEPGRDPESEIRSGAALGKRDAA